MLILVTGGCRSGKSGYAMERALALPGPWTFLATAQAFDEEMRVRIERHRRGRPPQWGLVEEPLAVADALSTALGQARTVIVDCVTLWISNLVCTSESFDEGEASNRARDLAARAHATSAAVIVVTNEVGSGIVPENALARRFRDCAGRANQAIAREADEVVLLTSGIPLVIKPAHGGTICG
jgi:adenosylcobinamide kinase / adenosylcobinamide-phosphate guanylyltransferase